MKLKTVLRRMTDWYLDGTCSYITSGPGMGKTETFVRASEIVGRELNRNLGHVIINGPLLSPADAVGYLIPKHHDTYSESLFTDPFWFKTRDGRRLADYDGGFIIIDEADKMDSDVKKVIGEAALSGRLGPHILHGNREGDTGWRIWMTGNRSEDRSGSTKELDHLINRRQEIAITPDLESLLERYAEKGVTPFTQSFTNAYPEIVLSGEVPKKQGPWCTPRSLEGLDKYMRLLARRHNDGEFTSDADTKEEARGRIGDASTTYFMHLELELKLPKWEKIIADPTGIKLPEKPDAIMLMCYHAAHKVSKETAEAAVKFVSRLPKEFAVTFAKSACQRDATLVLTPAFQAWIGKNASLMASISALGKK
jgi:hypothetical protein